MEMAGSKIPEYAIQLIMDAGVNAGEEVQLNKHISDLRTSLPAARLLIDRAECDRLKSGNRAEWDMLKSGNFAALLSKLKDTTYDAEDLLRGFDDQLARQKIEDEDRGRVGRILSSSLNLFKDWIRGSRRRLEEAQGNLSKVVGEVRSVLALMGPDVPRAQQLMPETSSVLPGPVFGRDVERDVAIEKLGVTIGREDVRDQAIRQMGVPLVAGAADSAQYAVGNERAAQGSPKRLKLKGESSRGAKRTTNNLSVLPIVGIGGVGKTTLAQYIFNDARVEEHFPLMLWVCVSDIFDSWKITKEIMEFIPRDGTHQPFDSSGSLHALQNELIKRLQGQKFLLVLDDMWEIAKNKWDNLCKPLKHGHAASMVLVTTRFPKVVDIVGTFKSKCILGTFESSISLEGLPKAVFWEFFSKCAFGEKHPDLYPELQDIGHKIADRLCGSPLAAKTLGRLLYMELTVTKWTTILNSELWDLRHEENEILPALQLTYLYLPDYLKRCFAVCSMFPKDYSFGRDELVRFWVAQCLVEPKENLRLEDVGCGYLDDLRSRFLFQNDPKSPEQDKYVMHDLIHDMAQSVSVDECFLMQGLSCQNRRRMPPHTVRCMSIEVDNEALSRMGGVGHLNKLHSLRFGMGLKVEDSWFNKLPNILFLSLKGCKLEMLPESICELNSLRYLDISNTSIEELPEKLWCLYTLQFLDARCSGLTTINQGVTKLVNLRWLKVGWDLDKLSGIGKLSSLQTLDKFTVEQKDGRKIGELKGMNQLSNTLYICSLASVQSGEEAAEARLVDKQYLKHLTLEWRNKNYGLQSGGRENRVLEGLHPPSSIESLTVRKFGGDNFPPSWLKQENLPALKTLSLENCNGIESLVLNGVGNVDENLRTTADATPSDSTGDNSVLQASINRSSGNACVPFKSLTSLALYCCNKLTNLDRCLSPEYLPSIKSISISSCNSIKSPPVHNFGGFTCLQDLRIHACACSWSSCPKEMVLPNLLQKLSFSHIGELDMSFRQGVCLENLASLTVLKLVMCENVESIPLNYINTAKLRCLVLSGCSKLSSIGELHRLSAILHVSISYCPKLTEVQQPFVEKKLRTKEDKELLKFL